MCVCKSTIDYSVLFWYNSSGVCTQKYIYVPLYILNIFNIYSGYTGIAVMSMCVPKCNLDYSSPAEPETGFDKKDIAGVGCSCNSPSIWSKYSKIQPILVLTISAKYFDDFWDQRPNWSLSMTVAPKICTVIVSFFMNIWISENLMLIFYINVIR